MIREPLEKDIQKAILQWLNARGFPCWRVNSGSILFKQQAGQQRRFVRFNTAAGCSDIIGLIPTSGGRMLCVEVKRPGNVPTPIQQSFLDWINRAGGLAFVATSVQDVEYQLRQAGVLP